MSGDEDGELLAGNRLLARVDEYLRENVAWFNVVRLSSINGHFSRVLAMRCRVIEGLADFLSDKVKLAVLAHQHDVVLVVGNVILLGGDVSRLKRRDSRKREIDIMALRHAIEVKNGIDISPRDVPRLVNEHFGEMLASAASKNTWWLCYLARRPSPKGKIGEVCMYYLVIVEIPVAPLVAAGGEACRAAVGDEAMRLADEIQKKGVDEDEVDEGFLVPVKNVWIVDKLREENKQKDKIIAEKDKIIAEKDKAMDSLARENADLKKRLGLK